MKKHKLIALSLMSVVLALVLQVVIARLDQNEQVRKVWVLNEAVASGQVLDMSKCVSMEVVEKAGQKDNYMTKEELLKKPQASYPLNAGTVLLKSHLSDANTRQESHSMVIKLDEESGHLGDFSLGEKVEVLCYRQGETKRVEQIEITSMNSVIQLDSTVYQFTLKGKVEDLEAIMLAKSEGIVRIIKKISVQ